ncbi:hypothetical protein LTR42_010944 [Elasticomyces elasticus]|nr:hypothetical protein LTR42_010944 [Elasticomyces elasticus]
MIGLALYSRLPNLFCLSLTKQSLHETSGSSSRTLHLQVTPSSERHLRFLGAHQQVNELNSSKHLENLTGTVLLHREITTSSMVKISAVLRRCERSSGDVTELREIDNTIGNVFNADNWYMVEAFALALLDYEPPEQVPLPPLYKAKMYTYLSGHPDYPEDSNLLVARSWIDRAIKDAIAHVGFIPAEMQERQDMIEKQLALPVPPTPSDLSLEGLTLGGMDGTVDGTMESSSTVEVPHNKDKCKQCLYYKYGDFVPEMVEPPAPETPLETATAKLADAQRKTKEIKAEDVAQQRLRQRLA